MTITEQALADLLLKYFTTLEPVGKDVTLKNEMKKVAQPDGSTKVQMVPKKGDAYLPKDVSNAMAKAIAKAVWPQFGGSSPYNEPWFEWNRQDLTQFDSPVYGTQVNQSSSVIDTVDYAGVKWIRMKLVTTASATSGNNGGMVLPISTTPPSADYVIVSDFVSMTRAGSDLITGAGLAVRFLDMEHGYIIRYSYGDPPSSLTNQDISKLNPGYSMTRLMNLSDPSIVSDGQGMFFGLAAEGQIIRALVGEKGFKTDSDHTSVGKAGLFQTSMGLASATTEAYYRNIRCYSLDVLKHTIP